MGMQEGAQYLIREYGLPLTEESYFSVMREVIAELYETVELKPGVRTMLAKLQAEGARMCICSNTWAEQCRTVLTRLGIAQYFSFIVEARGVLHKSHPEASLLQIAENNCGRGVSVPMSAIYALYFIVMNIFSLRFSTAARQHYRPSRFAFFHRPCRARHRTLWCHSRYRNHLARLGMHFHAVHARHGD